MRQFLDNVPSELAVRMKEREREKKKEQNYLKIVAFCRRRVKLHNFPFLISSHDCGCETVNIM